MMREPRLGEVKVKAQPAAHVENIPTCDAT